MHPIIPVIPAGRDLAGLSRAEPSFTPGKSDRLPSATPARSSAAIAGTGVGKALLRKLFWGTTGSSTDVGVDVCAELFTVCRTLQAEHLDARGITCFFNVEPGQLPKPICDSVGLLVRALILDAAEHAPTGIGDKTITVSLHRQHAIWACSVAHRGGKVTRTAGPRSWRAIAETHGVELKASFRTRSSIRGTITAAFFTLDGGSVPATAVH